MEGDGNYSGNTIYIKCNSSGYINETSFKIVWDSTKPNILTLNANPNPVIEYPLETKLVVETDDKTDCVYRGTWKGFNGGSGSLSGKFDEEWIDYHDVLVNLNDYRWYTFYVNCTNPSDLISDTKPINVTVNSSVSAGIRSVKPTGCIGNKTFNLSVETNKDSKCSYRIDNEGPIWFDNVWNITHKVKLKLEDGKHNIGIYCKFTLSDDSRTVSIDIDSKAPDIINITTPVVTYHDDWLSATIYGNSTGCIGIKYYSYMIKDGNNDIFLNITNKTTSSEKIDITAKNLKLKDLNTYYWFVKVVDTLGRENLFKKSDGTYLDKSLRYHCNNSIWDPGLDETDVDCGGECEGCDLGMNCSTSSDCKLGLQCINNTCQKKISSHCTNNVTDDSETDVDCGGNNDCTRCSIGEKCLVNSDCLSGLSCVNGYCVNSSLLDHCSNNVLDSNLGETGVDCGGSCPACSYNESCLNDSDCSTGWCNSSNICDYPSCYDGIKNGNETSVDCGGNCPDCDQGSHCLKDSDCLTGWCEPTTGTCQIPTCSDNITNGNETDVDCGGNCNPCAVGQSCLVDSDCTTNNCADYICKNITAVQDSDNDGLSDQDEAIYGTDPLNPDTDGDGYLDGEEVKAGTDPLDPNSYPGAGAGKKKSKTLPITLLIFGVLSLGSGIAYLFMKKKPPVAEQPRRLIPVKGVERVIKPREVKESEELMRKRLEEERRKKEELFKEFEEKPKPKKKVVEEIKEEIKPIKKKIPEIITKEKEGYVTLDELKQRVKKKDVFDKLEEISKKAKKSKQRLNLESIETKEDVFDKLDKLVKNKGTKKDLMDLIESKRLTKNKIIEKIVEASGKEKLNKNTFKVLLSYLIKRGKLSKKDLMDVVFELEGEKILNEKDVADILFSL